MKHPSPADLRMYLDHELPPEQHADVKRHVTDCRACAEQIETLAARSQRVQRLLSHLDPDEAQPPRPARQQLKKLFKKETIPVKKTFALPRAAWVALTIVAVLAVALAFQPVRALAGNLLGLFRVQQVTTLAVDTSYLNSLHRTAGEAISKLFNDSVEETRAWQESQNTKDATQAAELVGFTMRELLPPAEDTVYSVDFGAAFTFTVDVERANATLEAMGSGNLQLPADVDGAQVYVDVPASVTTYLPCDYLNEADRYKCLNFIQMPSPSITTDSPVDLPELAALGLQVMGLDEAQAVEMATTIDWQSTLVIPIPYGGVEAQTITVDGVSGQLLTREIEEMSEFALVWARDGMLYVLEGNGDPQYALGLVGGSK